jgi:orotidine-5'-phosphate decarboxylase
LPEPAPQNFADRLVARVRERGHPLCAGLDPHPKLIPPCFRRGSMVARDPETARAIEDMLAAFIDRLAGRVAVVKPQMAFFEELGWPGLRALVQLVARAREAGLLVLLDAKRGDIGSTAESYARAYLEPGAACEVDAITVNPWLGLETLEPFSERARAHGRGVFVLVKTSNAGSGDLQNQEVKGAPLYEQLARGLAAPAAALAGPLTGWSSLGVVVGATWPGEAERVRALLPKSLFLVPGYGAQGASARDAVRGFVPGPAGLEGGVVNSSRALLFPADAVSSTSATSWERAIDEALDRATQELAEAVTR